MSRQQIQSVVENFVGNVTPQVLAVTGLWGVGKTFTLKKIIESYTGSGSLKRYSYASVFGAQSIAEVRTLLLARTRAFPLTGDADAGVRAKVERQAGRIRFRETVDQLKETIPFGGKHLVIALETMAGSLLRDTLVVLDDFERLNEKVKMEDLMGLVSELREQAGCKVIMVFNEDGLSDDAKKSYALYAEKVVDQKLQFIMSPQDAVELGLPDDVPLRSFVTQPIQHLEIANIRVIQKIAGALRMIYPVIENCSPAVQQQAAISVAVFACALYERGREFPEPAVILKYNAFTYRRKLAEAGRDADKEAWVEKLEACGFTSADEFDAALLDAMSCGYVQGAAISEHAASLDEGVDRARLDGIFTDAWNLFHNRLDVTADELADAFVGSVTAAARVISPVNLNSTVKVLRELGLDEKADEIIEIYIGKRRDTPRIFDVDHHSRLGEVDDPRTRARFLEIFNNSGDALTLQEAADIIVANEHWDDRVVPAFVRAESEQLVELLMVNQGENLPKLISGMLNLPVGMEDRERVRLNVVGALTVVGRQSPLNRMKVKRWGVHIADA
ncbi:hypothetical protein A8E45_14930 [Burkholderia cenocepacia]|uniref:ATP-binding protein n=1 Tax=Burkholderia cenocepacia TaxID=95486 RepID=UPI0009820A71|nr:ATP-binding protein [Burkholderia cenocepacia]ONT74555.1 hypothetical protein A8E44_29670 [Burkholderia cenocepacia]ONT84243.1 hypothetical protein A8E45_30730 [Burkholderia cenocepacia]ONT93759.1 hypothetical protein A8E45_14930 [Burkholderia cenocepacia]